MTFSLGIHTAGPFCGVAILRDDTLIAVREQKMRRGHDQFLPGLVQEALAEASLEISQIDRFSVCVGPGSFTGIRIGVAFARGLALANGKQAFGITSLEALQSAPSDQLILALIPAKLRPPDQTFWAQKLDGTVRTEPFELSVHALNEHVSGNVQVITTPEGMETVETHAPGINPIAREIAVAGVPFWAQFIEPDQMRAPSPLYVRDPDAIPAKSPLL